MTSSNLYESVDLILPKSFFDQYVAKLIGTVESRFAFDRQVDLWWCAMLVGVKTGKRTSYSKVPIVSVENAGVLKVDCWRLVYLELLVLGEQDEDSALNPCEVIKTANEYALTGFNLLTEELNRTNEFQVQLFTHLTDYL